MPERNIYWFKIRKGPLINSSSFTSIRRLSDALKLKRATKRGPGRKSNRYASNDDSPSQGGHGHHYEAIDTPPGRLSAVSVPMPPSSRAPGSGSGGRTGVSKGKGSTGRWSMFQYGYVMIIYD